MTDDADIQIEDLTDAQLVTEIRRKMNSETDFGYLMALFTEITNRFDAHMSSSPISPVAEEFFKPLAPRERAVVDLLLAGGSTKAISEKLELTISTVNTYIKRIFAKLGVRSRVELVAKATGRA